MSKRKSMSMMFGFQTSHLKMGKQAMMLDSQPFYKKIDWNESPLKRDTNLLISYSSRGKLFGNIVKIFFVISPTNTIKSARSSFIKLLQKQYSFYKKVDKIDHQKSVQVYLELFFIPKKLLAFCINISMMRADNLLSLVFNKNATI